MRSRRRAPYALRAVILIVFVASAARVHAAVQDPSASIFSFSAFGTLGLVHSSEDDADFTASPLQPTGAGYTRPWSPAVDSRLGAQLTVRFTPQLSAMLQVIAEQRNDDTCTPHVEWANISYQATPDFSVRLGRIVLPTFLLSDSRKVGRRFSVHADQCPTRISVGRHGECLQHHDRFRVVRRDRT
jgi:hypothetical protein